MTIDVTAAVIFKGDKVLMSTRPPGKHLEGYWEFPGGKVGSGESHFDGLVRELIEELDVHIIPLDKLFVIKHDYTEKTVRITFYRSVPDQNFKFKPNPKEGQLVDFFSLSILETLNIVPADKPLVKYLSLLI